MPTQPTSAMREGLARLSRKEDLDVELVTRIFREIMGGTCEPAQVGGLLMGLAIKGETMDEVIGAATAMREAVVPVPTRAETLVDTCGTGGSGFPRRNVSTAVAICLAACGVHVAKHGNRGASSPSGSADVLEALGVNITASPERVGTCVDEVGVGFLFAPTLHPAMKHAVGPRRALGVRTIFNLLGPLTNPAGASRQLLGVFDPRRCEPLAGALAALGSERVWVVHGFREGVSAHPESTPGIDDLSTEGESLVAEARGGQTRTFVITPEAAGLSRVPLTDLAGGDPPENAQALQELLDGAPGAYRTAVQFAGAAALLTTTDGDLDGLPALARRIGEVLDRGDAKRTLATLVECSHGRGRGSDGSP